jgi:hypothetical protein
VALGGTEAKSDACNCVRHPKRHSYIRSTVYGVHLIAAHMCVHCRLQENSLLVGMCRHGTKGWHGDGVRYVGMNR